MKVITLGADKGGCFMYRLQEPSRVAGALGVDVETNYDLEVEAFEDTKTKLVEVREVLTDADLIIIQRPLHNSFASVIRQAKRQGIATIVELDDDFDATSKHNVAYDNMFSYSHSNVNWLKEACLEADHVTVSTPALEKYAPHGRVSVLRNYVPESIFDITPRYERNVEPFRIGWTGSTQTHPTDLQVTKGVIGQTLKNNGLSFGVVGDGAQVQSFLKLSSLTPFKKTGWVGLDQYYEEIVKMMDLGIVPLELSNFNQAKSHLKGIEMAALGIPFIASDTREYQRLAAYGVGKTARNPGEWRRHIQRWIDRPEQMIRDAKNYRDKIEAEFTYEQNAHEWVDVWEQTVAYRKSHNYEYGTVDSPTEAKPQVEGASV